MWPRLGPPCSIYPQQLKVLITPVTFGFKWAFEPDGSGRYNGLALISADIISGFYCTVYFFSSATCVFSIKHLTSHMYVDDFYTGARNEWRKSDATASIIIVIIRSICTFIRLSENFFHQSGFDSRHDRRRSDKINHVYNVKRNSA